MQLHGFQTFGVLLSSLSNLEASENSAISCASYKIGDTSIGHTNMDHTKIGHTIISHKNKGHTSIGHKNRLYKLYRYLYI